MTSKVTRAAGDSPQGLSGNTGINSGMDLRIGRWDSRHEKDLPDCILRADFIMAQSSELRKAE
jgi:hypothetical protein